MAEGKADSAPPYPHTPLPLPKAAPHDPMDVCLCVCTCMHACMCVCLSCFLHSMDVSLALYFCICTDLFLNLKHCNECPSVLACN